MLAEFLPLKTYIYFPVLYSICVWAVRRIFDLKERVLAWQVWLEPGMVESKPDAFILNFFERTEGVREAFAEEVRVKDMTALRKAFAGLYPVCGLEDAFLLALFQEDLEAGDFRKIADEFGNERPGPSRTSSPPGWARSPGAACKASAWRSLRSASMSCPTFRFGSSSWTASGRKSKKTRIEGTVGDA